VAATLAVGVFARLTFVRQLPLRRKKAVLTGQRDSIFLSAGGDVA
jgi:hypothetical protein